MLETQGSRPHVLSSQAHLCSDKLPVGGRGVAGASSVAAYSVFPGAEVRRKSGPWQGSQWWTKQNTEDLLEPLSQLGI
jgi:hypothetical protein